MAAGLEIRYHWNLRLYDDPVNWFISNASYRFIVVSLGEFAPWSCISHFNGLDDQASRNRIKLKIYSLRNLLGARYTAHVFAMCSWITEKAKSNASKCTKQDRHDWNQTYSQIQSHDLKATQVNKKNKIDIYKKNQTKIVRIIETGPKKITQRPKIHY